MALKKKIERDYDELAYQAHQLWEQDREEREQVHIITLISEPTGYSVAGSSPT
jgi:hypothetical protein